MAAITITNFSGEQPRVLPRLLPPTAAQSAFNLRLDDGGLTPVRQSVQHASLERHNARSLYKHQGRWLAWENDVHACPGPVAMDRLYYTGDGVPSMRIDNQIFPLAVPKPQKPLTLKLEQSEASDDTITSRFYVYTWVTSFGEESEPCPAGDAIDWKPGQTIRISGFATPPSGRAIVSQRIYRTQTGTNGTYLYFIAERAATTQDFIDDIAPEKFNEALPSQDWNAPPDDLQGLTTMPNGMMAGFSGRDLYFCEPWHPHAWPRKYSLTTDAPIIGLGAIGMSLIVLTNARPYLVTGSHPDSMQMVKLEANYPCINARAIVDLGVCIVYPSYEGLVAIGGDGNVRLISANLFNRDTWHALGPDTMLAGQVSGRYVAFYDTVHEGSRLKGALYIDAGETPYLIRSGESAQAVHYDIETGGLYFVRPDDNQIYRLDSPDADRTEFYWKSRQFILPVPESFGVVRVDTEIALTGKELAIRKQKIEAIKAANRAMLDRGPVGGEIAALPVCMVPHGGDLLSPLPRESGNLQVGIWADGKKIAQISRTNIAHRLPSGFTARKWEIDCSGDMTISAITLAKTIDELKGSA